MRAIVITVLVIATTVFGITPAGAVDGVPSPKPQALPWCESTRGVLTRPMAYGVTSPLATPDGMFRALPASGGAVLTTAWQDLMTGFAFDGQVDGIQSPGGYIETDLTINYRFPTSSCERTVEWETDLDFVLPNGARTLGDPQSVAVFSMAAVADPLGDLSVPIAARDNSDFSVFLKVFQANGELRRIRSLSGSMVIPPGAPGNLFIIVKAQLASYGGPYCLGLCGQAYSSELDREGVFDLVVPDAIAATSGIAYVARRSG